MNASRRDAIHTRTNPKYNSAQLVSDVLNDEHCLADRHSEFSVHRRHLCNIPRHTSPLLPKATRRPPLDMDMSCFDGDCDTERQAATVEALSLFAIVSAGILGADIGKWLLC